MKTRAWWNLQRRLGGARWLPALALLLPTLALLAPEVAHAHKPTVERMELRFGSGGPTNDRTIREGDRREITVRPVLSGSSSHQHNLALHISATNFRNFLGSSNHRATVQVFANNTEGQWTRVSWEDRSRIGTDNRDEDNAVITVGIDSSGANLAEGYAVTFTIEDDDLGVGVKLGDQTDGDNTRPITSVDVTEGGSFTLTYVAESAFPSDGTLRMQISSNLGERFNVPLDDAGLVERFDRRENIGNFDGMVDAGDFYGDNHANFQRDRDDVREHTFSTERLRGITTSSESARKTLADDVDDPNLTLTISVVGGDGYVPGNSSLGRPGSVTVNLQDDDNGIWLAPAGMMNERQISVPEGETFEVQVYMDSALSSDITGQAPTFDPPGDSDRFENASLGINAGETAGEVFTITAANNDANEPDRVVELTLGGNEAWGNVQSGWRGPLTVTIVDDDDDEARIAASAVTVKEGDTLVLTVTLDRALAQDTSVQIDLSGGATFGIEDGATTTTILAGSLSAELSLPIPDDFEFTEEATLTASIARTQASAPHSTFPSSVNVTLQDNSLGLSTTGPSAPVAESEAVTFTLNATRAPGEETSFTVMLTGGAAFGIEENSTTSVMLAADATSVPFAVTPDNDSVEEADGTLTATVIDGDGFYVTAAAVAMIEDDDLLVEMAAETATVTEGETVNITLSVGENVDADTVITVDVEGGAAFDIEDGATTTTILTGQRTAVLSLDTEDDAADDADATLSVTVSAVDGYTSDQIENISNPLSKTTVSAEVALEDNDLRVELRLAAKIEEYTAGTWVLQANREESLDVETVVNVRLDGAADYGIADGTEITVTISADQTSGTENLAIVDDTVDDPDGTLTATVLDGTGYVWDSDSHRTAQLVDDDIEASISTSGDPVDEGSDVVFTVTLSSSHRLGEDVNVNVELVLNDGLTDGGDYGIDFDDPMTTGTVETRTTRTVTISSGTEGRLTLETIDDTADDADGNVSATVVAGTGYLLGTPSSATATLRDDDIEVSVHTDSAWVEEGSQVVFTVRSRSPVPAAGLDVDVRLYPNHHRIRGDDYGITDQSGASIGPGTVRTIAIASGGTEGTLTLETDNDMADDRDGDVRADVLAGNGYTPGMPRFAVANLRDDDVEIVEILTFQPTAREGGYQRGITIGVYAKTPVRHATTVNLSLQRTGGSFTMEHDGSALSAADFLRLEGIYRYRSSTYVIIDDSLEQADGVLTATVENGSYSISASPSSVEVALENDDFFASVAMTTDEISEGQPVRFVVSTGQPVQEDTVVNYTVTVNDELTDDPGDFGIEAHQGTLTILADQRSAGSPDIDALRTVRDNVEEKNGSVTVTLQDGTGYTVSATAASDTVTVTDPQGDPDVNKDGSVTQQDALILYYSYSLRNSLGTGRGGAPAESE